MGPTGGEHGSGRLRVLVDPAELTLQTWLKLVRFRDRMGRRVEETLGRHGLSPAQFDVLATLHSGEGITQQELARMLLVTKGNVCGLVDRTEAAGWVERRADPDDRRANRLYLTEGGRKILAETVPDHRALVREILGGLDGDELQTLHALFDRLDERRP